MIRFGIDLGGTKVELLAMDSKGQELIRRRCATPQGDYRGTLEAIVELIREAERDLGTKARIGIGTPGAVSKHSGRMKNCNSTCLNDQPLQQDLERLLSRPVRIANDADCFALSEATDGAAEGASVVFGVILGTGVGGGIVIRKRLLEGPNAIAGEWGHNPLPWPTHQERPGPVCYCGRSGCIETFLSGPGLSRAHHATTGNHLDAHTIVDRADAGDESCNASLKTYEHRLARALAHIINIIDPQVIVLGGGLSNCGRLYRNVPAMWGKYVFSDHVDTHLVPPRHGDSSGVRGAAWLWPA